MAVDPSPQAASIEPVAAAGVALSSTSAKTPLLEVEHLVKHYALPRERLFAAAPRVEALRGVSFTMQAGTSLGLVGESGSGKSTLARQVMALERPTAGRVTLLGRDLNALSPAELRAARRDFQMVFQDPYGSLDPRMRVADLVGEALRALPSLDAAARAARVRHTLVEVGLDPSFGARFPHELSGGQRQRVAIARAIVREPAFVVADEPVSALDMTVQKQILALIRALQDKHGFACLFVSHDLGAVEQVADRVLVMDDGLVVEHGPRDQVFDHARHPVTRRLLGAMPALQPEGSGFRLLRREFAQA